jgi:hypothetical protein
MLSKILDDNPDDLTKEDIVRRADDTLLFQRIPYAVHVPLTIAHAKTVRGVGFDNLITE